MDQFFSCDIYLGKMSYTDFVLILWKLFVNFVLNDIRFPDLSGFQGHFSAQLSTFQGYLFE